MPTHSHLPKPAADPSYLIRLRQQALARILEDEAEAAPPALKPRAITRRSTLQTLGLLAAAAPFLRAAEALATPGPRAAAPQYGAAGLPGNPPIIAPKAFTPRAELALDSSWKSSSALLLTDRAHDYIYNGSQPAMLTYVQLPSGEPLGLQVVADPRSRMTYVVNANALFHAWTGTDLVGIRFGYAELIVTPSIYKQPTTPAADPAVIAKFAAEVDDRTLAKLASPTRDAHIPLNKGVPAAFWGPAPVPGSNPRYPELYSASVADGILEFACNSYTSYSSFKVDLKAKKMIAFKSG